MERLLASGNAVEDAAREKQILRMVQRELAEADEANLLEEEDMHVFEREPLADRLMLVSCNICKKPIKSSQYISHAERCRSLFNSDEAPLELDGGTGHRRPPRKARKKLLSPQDNYNSIGGDTERSQSMDGDDVTPDSAIAPGSNSETQTDGFSGSGNHQAPRRVVNSAEHNAGSRSARLQKLGSEIGAELTAHTRGDSIPVTGDCDGVGLGNTGSIAQSFMTADDLDRICGVRLSDYSICRQPLTCKAHSESMKHAVLGRSQPFDLVLKDYQLRNACDLKSQERDSIEIPVPLATKVYYFRHRHQMRAVLGHLFREAWAGPSSSSGTSRTSTSEEQGASYGVSQHLPVDNCAPELQQRTFPINQKKDTNVPPLFGVSTNPVQVVPQDMGISCASNSPLPTPRTSNQQQENKLGYSASPADLGQPTVLRSRVMQASQLLGISSPGSLNSIQQSSLGSVHVT